MGCAATGTEKPEDLPVGHLQLEVVYGKDVAISLGQPICPNHALIHVSPFRIQDMTGNRHHRNGTAELVEKSEEASGSPPSCRATLQS